MEKVYRTALEIIKVLCEERPSYLVPEEVKLICETVLKKDAMEELKNEGDNERVC